VALGWKKRFGQEAIMNLDSTERRKSISLTFRGFEIQADAIPILLGVAATRLGNRGEPVKSGVKTRLTRSYTIFSMNFTSDYDLSDMFSELLVTLGGCDRLIKVRDEIKPEFIEFYFDLPVQHSEESQDGFLSELVIADMYELKASVAFGFF
jgi:hypothetical protein